MQIWKLHLHVISCEPEGWFLESDIKADWCIQLPKKMNVASFISHSIFSTRRVRKTLKLLMATHWLTPNLSETTMTTTQSNGGKQKMFQRGFIEEVVVGGSRRGSLSLREDATERRRVWAFFFSRFFFFFLHHRLRRSDSWDKTRCLLLPPPWSRAAMGKCQSTTSAFCF